MYVITIEIWDGKRWTEKVYRKGYNTIQEAANAFAYIAHHNNELGSKLSIRMEG